MKIAINTLPLLRNKAGAEQYTLNIIKKIAEIDKTNTYFILTSTINKDIYNIEQSNFLNISIPLNTTSKLKRILYEQLILPFRLKNLKIDVLFSPCNVMPLFSPCFNVTMIFDMHWFVESSKLSTFRLFYVKNFIKWSAVRTNKILTLSQSSKNDIVTYTKVNPKKITVVPIAITPLCLLKNSLQKKDWTRIKQKFNLNKKYILFLGQLLYRKNVDLVIKAVSLIKEENGDLNFDFVIIGGFKEAYEYLKNLVHKKSLENNVKFLGEIDDIEVAYILSNASLFVYPSLYEGFGIPVLEAMFYEIPTITSNVSSLPEVGGDACLYIDPKDEESLKSKILDLLENLKIRQELKEKSKTQVLKFDWNDITQKTLDVLMNKP